MHVSPHASSVQVTGYYVYFAEADGSLRSLLGNTTEDATRLHSWTALFL